MALYSFIQSLNTNFGTNIFEPVAEELGLKHFDTIQRQIALANTITKKAQRAIQDIMDSLESINSKPNKNKVDLFLQKSDDMYLIDIKTAKPNKGGFKEFKRTLNLGGVFCVS